MQLDDLSKDPSEMTDEELRDRIIGIRNRRRNFSRVVKKAAVKKAKADNVDWNEIEKLLDEVEGKG